jgi:hypothetical protein
VVLGVLSDNFPHPRNHSTWRATAIHAGTLVLEP